MRQHLGILLQAAAFLPIRSEFRHPAVKQQIEVFFELVIVLAQAQAMQDVKQSQVQQGAGFATLVDLVFQNPHRLIGLTQ